MINQAIEFEGKQWKLIVEYRYDDEAFVVCATCNKIIRDETSYNVFIKDDYGRIYLWEIFCEHCGSVRYEDVKKITFASAGESLQKIIKARENY